MAAYRIKKEECPTCGKRGGCHIHAYYKRITEKPIKLPDGTVKQYSHKTLEKWVSQYQLGGIDALMPGERSDKGTTRVLPDTAIEEIYRLNSARNPNMKDRKAFEEDAFGKMWQTDTCYFPSRFLI